MRIIIVYNNLFGLFCLKRKIKKVLAPNWEIKSFKRSSEALQYAKDHPVNVALLDMESAQIHGLVTARKLQEINSRINLILLSESKEYLTEAWEIHVSDYIMKPVEQGRIKKSFKNLRYAPGSSD